VLAVVDTSGVRDQPAGAEVEALGADSAYLHYGADQRRADATKDCTQWLDAGTAAVRVPWLRTFGVVDGDRGGRRAAPTSSSSATHVISGVPDSEL
jgi:hypothetical protein